MSALRRLAEPHPPGVAHPPVITRTVTGVPEASLTFPAELDSVGAARRFFRTTLLGWDNGNYEFAAPLVLTELATNATLHARTPYTVRLTLEDTHLVVEVVDSSPRLPQARSYTLDATTGRGINIVNAFSDTWGAREIPEGKVVWAHVRPDEPDMLAFAEKEQDDLGADAAARPAAKRKRRKDPGSRAAGTPVRAGA
jgi:hypothetical protein